VGKWASEACISSGIVRQQDSLPVGQYITSRKLGSCLVGL
jgi:hypothetical protein